VAIFQKYLADTKAFILHTETIDVKSVISDYFNAKKPFGETKDKKSEFPDAFNLSMLRKYAFHNPPVIIVSDDGDFSDEENIYCFKTLKELLDAINSQDELTRELTHNVKDYLKGKHQVIFDKIHEILTNYMF